MVFARSHHAAIFSALALGTCGCLGPRQSDYTVSRSIAIERPSDTADALWESALEALRRHRFRLDRTDREAGIITTLPTTSQSALEFWRHDVDASEDLWESTISPIRRWVTVKLSSPNEKTWSELSVVVEKQRLSSPDRQFNSSGAAYQFFGNRLPSTTGAAQLTADDDRWLSLGRDPAMESRLLKHICELAGLAALAPDKRPNEL